MALINTTTTGVLGSTFYADGSGDLTIQQNGVLVNKITSAPAFSAYNSSSTTLISATYTKVALQTEVFDTNSYFDNATNYRFTPLISGYYQINGGISTNNPAGAVTSAIYKNGSVYAKGSINVPQAATTLAASVVSSVVYFNGSTDYVELYGLQTNGSSQTTNANSYDTYFNGSMVRSA